MEVLPGVAWSEPPPVRLLEICGVGAEPTRRALIGLILDGMWAPVVSQMRTGRPAKETIIARISAMARLSPAMAFALDSVRFTHESAS